MHISFDAATVALIALSAIVLALAGYIVYLDTKLKKFLSDKNATSIGDSIASLAERAATIERFRAELESYLSTVEKRLQNSVQAVETVRFNPFGASGGGGNQSFATAFVDENGDGVIISSLYSRDAVSIFGKPVKGHASDYELSEEEKEAMKKAREKLK